MTNQEKNIPKHVAVIMDGNGRWAQNQGKPRVFGHRAGLDALQNIAIHAQNRGVKVLTVYAFSTENWTRPAAEVKFIMSLPIDFYEKFVPTLKRENIRVSMIGKRDGVPKATLKSIDKAMVDTADNTGMILNIALNYGGQDEILDATKAIADAIKTGQLMSSEITKEVFEDYLTTANLPSEYRNPDFVIRTSGEHRLSNFLPWQTAYSELYFTETLWPDFDDAALDLAFAAFEKRDRRYGGIKK
ncbi:isoprenyl transferase [Pseudolactococcus insecticola]|uniref:Isoprenyl transferase n=1 Tax=Pseudolactococcus insecticola TaxID=2709158 RepID=A0A6A0B9I9_9LACT|nr:isoprenyl transferase [Lactococcus insecticola]GFH40487.1 isoprenyl transferase [Lactococcus insecticola]